MLGRRTRQGRAGSDSRRRSGFRTCPHISIGDPETYVVEGTGRAVEDNENHGQYVPDYDRNQGLPVLPC